MTIHSTRQYERVGQARDGWTIAAWASLGLLVLAGLAGALGVG
jgi:hypothetical protein